MIKTRWVVGDENTTDFYHVPWIFYLPLSWWPTFVSMQMGESVRVLDLLHPKHRGWQDDHVAQFFGLDLASHVLSIVVPTYEAHDMRL